MSPGDLVVCVNAGVIPGAYNNYIHLLKKGDVYTVDEVAPRGPAGIRIIEVPIFSGDDWWHAARFRPCRKTNIYALVECAKERKREDVE